MQELPPSKNRIVQCAVISKRYFSFSDEIKSSKGISKAYYPLKIEQIMRLHMKITETNSVNRGYFRYKQ